MIKMENQH